MVTRAAALLTAARLVLDEPGRLGRGGHRSAALLTRGALEAALGRWLDGRAPGARSANFSVQLQCLHRLSEDRDMAARVAWTWAALSQATHHHGYELPPTRQDLERWLAVVHCFAEHHPHPEVRPHV